MQNNGEQEQFDFDIIENLTRKRDNLREQIGNLIRSQIFQQRHTLHPRDIDSIAEKYVNAFLQFIKSKHDQIPAELGSTIAQKGITISTALDIYDTIYRFIILLAKKYLSYVTINDVLFEFGKHFFESYHHVTNDMILQQQEQLRKALSAAILQQKKELAIMNHAIKTTLHGILLTNPEGDVEYINPALKELLEKSGMKEANIKSIQDILGADTSRELFEQLDTINTWQGELSFFKESGNKIDVFVSASNIKDNGENQLGIMLSFIDITERKKLESQIRQSQKMEALGQLAGGISHDFNNILAAISGYAELQLLDFPEGSQQYNDTMQIKLAADRGKELTKQLLFFTRRSNLERKTLDLNDIIRETVVLLERTFPPEIKIQKDLAENLGLIEGNPAQINQIIMNLCVNARDAIVNAPIDENAGSYTANRGIIKITTCNVYFNYINAPLFPGAKPGKYVCLQVKDSGHGMSGETIDRIFEPFFTTKKEAKGTGLGLSVVYGIVQNHNGFIDVKSEPGIGSSFKIYLPVLKKNPKPSISKRPEEEIYPGTGTILLVEDEPQVRNMEIRALEKCGYRVIIAKNGIQAIEIFKEKAKDIDLVILDMIMPEMGGKECYYHLREINPLIKILIITGYIEDTLSSSLLENRNTDLLAKPFKLNEFTKKVYKVINSD